MSKSTFGFDYKHTNQYSQNKYKLLNGIALRRKQLFLDFNDADESEITKIATGRAFMSQFKFNLYCIRISVLVELNWP